MMAHTPGPWLREGTLVYALEECTWLGNPSMRNRFDCNVQSATTSKEELEDTARLIQTAPKLKKDRDALLRALGDLVGLARCAMRLANRDGAEFDIDAELADAMTAIAEAEEE